MLVVVEEMEEMEKIEKINFFGNYKDNNDYIKT